MYYLVILASIFLLNTNLAVAQEQQTEEAATTNNTINYNGDIERGSEVFFRCSSCHSIESDSDTVTIGPDLIGIFGRQVGSNADYNEYSKALREATFIWDETKLDNWLKNPNGFLPGNTMAFNGILRQKDRDDIIAFIRHEGEN